MDGRVYRKSYLSHVPALLCKGSFYYQNTYGFHICICLELLTEPVRWGVPVRELSHLVNERFITQPLSIQNSP